MSEAAGMTVSEETFAWMRSRGEEWGAIFALDSFSYWIEGDTLHVKMKFTGSLEAAAPTL